MSDSHDDETVACPKCGHDVWAYTQRCSGCGIWFQGEAWQVAGRDSGGGLGWGYRLVAILLLMAMGLLVLMGMW